MKQLTGNTEMENALFRVTEQNFEAFALEVFQFQYAGNAFYQEYCDALARSPGNTRCLEQVPFLPIEFFKTQEIVTTAFTPGVVFESSGTTGSVNSRHFVKDTGLYEKSFGEAFKQFYGDVSQYCILGLLPSYLERKNSSLVWMVNELICQSHNPGSGFYLYDIEKLHQTLLQNEQKKQPSLLIGVTYALLDFFEKYPMRLEHCIIMETGGMKGRKKELTREEVHHRLVEQTAVKAIHAEYGMTELLSQAYAKSSGKFECPPWMKVCLRTEDDPFELIIPGNVGSPFRTGVINVIDLANLYSCSFIATDDMGKLYPGGSFEVLGRLDNSDIRGCSLMLL